MKDASTVIPLITPSISEAVETNAEGQALAQALSALAKWRTTKTKSAEPIPTELWQQIFALEKFYSPIQLRRFFSLSTRQYETKKSALFSIGNEAHPQQSERSATDVSPAIDSPTLCQVTLKKGDKPSDVKKINPYALEPLPSAKTVVVEFCRSDGQMMKIHTPQDSIPT